ncbi:MAG: hypothetical protein J07HB67_00906 [halophilic archaeon J07HB67]|jgi:hypothetical protein|nr:MAG: hypothetical protein J07HB67_00906 [halophilic archaeon J07HB67]
MDAETFCRELEADRQSQLDRLGSERLPVALTDGEPTGTGVLRAAANSEHAAHVTFREWATTADDRAGEGVDTQSLFAWTADREADHREQVCDTLDAGYDPVDGGTLHTYLRERATPVERVAAGLVARPVVSERTHSRLVSFFDDRDGEAAAGRAALFRTLRRETAEERRRGLDALDGLCATADDWERARMVAGYTVQVVYDDFLDTLAGLGD